MAARSFIRSGFTSTYPKYADFLVGNEAYNPFAFDLIETQTVGAGGAASITFSSIPGTYKHLQIRGILRSTVSGTGTLGAQVRMNGDTGANYSSSHVLYGNGTSALSAAGATSQDNGSLVNYPQGSTTANCFAGIVADILDYASTSKYKTVRGLGGVDLNDTNGILTFRSFAWMSTSAVTSVSIIDAGGGNLAQYSTFSLYGVK